MHRHVHKKGTVPREVWIFVYRRGYRPCGRFVWQKQTIPWGAHFRQTRGSRIDQRRELGRCVEQNFRSSLLISQALISWMAGSPFFHITRDDRIVDKLICRSVDFDQFGNNQRYRYDAITVSHIIPSYIKGVYGCDKHIPHIVVETYCATGFVIALIINVRGFAPHRENETRTRLRVVPHHNRQSISSWLFYEWIFTTDTLH